MSSFVTALVASAQAVCRLLLLCVPGFVMQRNGLFPKEASDAVGKLSYCFLLPALLFVSLGTAVTSFQQLLALWPLPVAAFFHVVLGVTIASLIARLLEFQPESGHFPRRRVLVALMGLKNSAYLPLVLLSVLEAREAEAMGFLGVYLSFYVPLEWFIGPLLFRERQEVGPTSAPKDSWPARCCRFVESHLQECVCGFSLIVSCTKLRLVFFEDKASPAWARPVQETLTAALELTAAAVTPVVMTILGANIASETNQFLVLRQRRDVLADGDLGQRGTETEKPSSNLGCQGDANNMELTTTAPGVHLNVDESHIADVELAGPRTAPPGLTPTTVVTVVLTKLVVVPAVASGVTFCFPVASLNPVVLFVILIQAAMPSPMNLIVMAIRSTMSEAGQRAVSWIIFVQYVMCILTITCWCTIFLYLTSPIE